jgi:hypothetical protein
MSVGETSGPPTTLITGYQLRLDSSRKDVRYCRCDTRSHALSELVEWRAIWLAGSSG